MRPIKLSRSEIVSPGSLLNKKSPGRETFLRRVIKFRKCREIELCGNKIAEPRAKQLWNRSTMWKSQREWNEFLLEGQEKKGVITKGPLDINL